MITAVCLLVLTQTRAPASETKELPPSTRPAVELALFRKMKGVTVSEYFGKSAGNNKAIRVYRFTYKAKFADEGKRWRTLFPTKSGWKVEEDSATLFMMSRKLTHPRVREQVLMLHQGKIAFDPKSPARTKPIVDSGWVWISFNELFKVSP